MAKPDKPVNLQLVGSELNFAWTGTPDRANIQISNLKDSKVVWPAQDVVLAKGVTEVSIPLSDLRRDTKYRLQKGQYKAFVHLEEGTSKGEDQNMIFDLTAEQVRDLEFEFAVRQAMNVQLIGERLVVLDKMIRALENRIPSATSLEEAKKNAEELKKLQAEQKELAAKFSALENTVESKFGDLNKRLDSTDASLNGVAASIKAMQSSLADQIAKLRIPEPGADKNKDKKDPEPPKDDKGKDKDEPKEDKNKGKTSPPPPPPPPPPQPPYSPPFGYPPYPVYGVYPMVPAKKGKGLISLFGLFALILAIVALTLFAIWSYGHGGWFVRNIPAPVAETNKTASAVAPQLPPPAPVPSAPSLEAITNEIYKTVTMAHMDKANKLIEENARLKERTSQQKYALIRAETNRQPAVVIGGNVGNGNNIIVGVGSVGNVSSCPAVPEPKVVMVKPVTVDRVVERTVSAPCPQPVVYRENDCRGGWYAGIPFVFGVGRGRPPIPGGPLGGPCMPPPGGPGIGNQYGYCR